MNTEELIAHGNNCREQNNPEQALAYYAQALTQDRGSASAFNNYGNVLRELGDPEGAVPFLQRSVQLDNNITAKFNLAVAYLLMGDYQKGWAQYEARWQYEHLAGLLPNYKQPRWDGQELKDKTILVLTEQGHGDNIQFSRFLLNLHNLGAKIILKVDANLCPLIADRRIVTQVYSPDEEVTAEFDYWTPIMSIPGALRVTLDNLPANVQYLSANTSAVKDWQERMGPKNKLRVGFCWSGRRDSWINQHKAMPFETMFELIKRNPNYEWVNLQIDCSPEEEAQLVKAGVKTYPGTVSSWADTAALVHCLDVVLSVDTAIGHLSCALGRPTWVMLSNYALDWRWLLNRDSSPWYPTARLFRQPTMGDWKSVTDKVHKFLGFFKI
jgi:hypothetical protein